MKKRKKALPVPKDDKKPQKPFNWRLLLLVFVNTVILYGLYRLAILTRYFKLVMIVYMTVTAGLIVAYLIYNRGMSRKGITWEMLPDTMTPEEKTAYLADGEQRLKKSKWMLTIILPLVLTFFFDAVELFLGDYFMALFR